MRYWLQHVKMSIRETGLRFGLDIRRLSVRRAGRFGRDVLSDCRTILEPRCVFDVGANVGMSSLKFLYAFPKADIWAFEPSPQSFPALELLAHARSRVHPVQAAVGAETTVTDFHCNRFSQTDSLLPAMATADEYLVETGQLNAVNVTTVPVVSLDDFCAEHNIDRIDLLKLDTQGYEIEALKGAADMLVAERMPLILAEVCFVPVYVGQPLFPEVYQYLYDRDYRLVNLYGNTFSRYYYQMGTDALFIHRAIAERIDPDSSRHVA